MSLPDKRLPGKRALVTGAGSGIGRAIARRFAMEGAHVAINDVNGDSARKTADELKAMGVETMVLEADITDSDQVKSMIDSYYKEFSRLDILVNNAGIGASASRIISMPEETWDRIIRTNLKGTFLVSKHAGRKMAKQEVPDGEMLRGKIINIASTRARAGRAKFGAYSASKAGVLNLTQTLALELGARRITVNCICPGLIHTPIYGNISYEELAGTNAEQITLAKVKPVGLPEDVAGVAFFLASHDADWITGQAINVDGGMMFN